MKLRLGPPIGVLWRVVVVLSIPVALKPAAAQPGSFAGNAQHTAVFDVPAQPLNSIHWSTSINLSRYALPDSEASRLIARP